MRSIGSRRADPAGEVQRDAAERTSRSSRCRLHRRLDEHNLLGTLPEERLAQIAQVLVSLDDRREVVARELARLRGEVDVAVCEQDLGLRDAARVEHDLAGVRVARGVLGPEPEVEVAERDPAGLARPADVDDFRLERQKAPEGCDGRRRVGLLEASRELVPASLDLEHRRRSYFPAAPETYAATSAISCGESFPANEGITPSPFVTRSVTRSAEGFAASRLGPTVPVAPATASVWQAPQPAEAKRALPRATSAVAGGCAAVSSERSTRTATRRNAAAPATGIHQCVRPVWRRLKKSRAHAPIAISATSTSHAWSAP